MKNPYIQRILDAALQRKLTSYVALLIRGMKACGNKESVKKFASSIISFDDEWQEYPKICNYIKHGGVDSHISTDFKSGNEFLVYLNKNSHPKICFQIIPERWSDNKTIWLIQKWKDLAINFIKNIISKF